MVQHNVIMLLVFTFSLKFYISYSLPFSFHDNYINSFDWKNSENSYDNIQKKHHLLPRTITPIEYHLKFLPYFENGDFIFIGETRILLYINNDTDQIILNSLDLVFNKTTVEVTKIINKDDEVSENIYVSDLQICNNTELVTIKTEALLTVGSSYNLIINYTGYISEHISGFYRSWYLNNGTTRWIGVTQMESPFARTVFPCFDEPRFKTPFTIQIARYEDTKTVSNMPLSETTLPDPSIDNRVWDIYEKSPPMSTYLVAFCIFDFKPVKNEHVTVWVQPNVIDQAEYILTKVQHILSILNNYTMIDYNITKMELVAVPDFSFGAMENWGLTTYREKYLLYKPNISTALDMQNILSIVAHEMSHQWFGNLVTPVWWDYLWLNEAFATFFEYYIPSLMEPSWRMMEQFVVRELQYALSEDVEDGHPLNANVTTPDEIEANFDVYEYSKGGSIVRMLQHFSGADNFKAALQQYLSDGVNQTDGIVNPKNLWNAFRTTLPADVLPQGVSIEDIMKTWTDQRGFPLITVKRDYKNRSITISQKEFLGKENTENSTQWWIPITFTDSKEVNFTIKKPNLWLQPQETAKIKFDTDGWILFNVQQTGYYRVNYDIKNWNLLVHQLLKNHTIIHPVNRAQIIDDAFALAEAGIITYDIPFNLSRYLINELDYIPWFSATKAFKKITDSLYFSRSGSLLKAFIKKLVRPIYHSITEIPPENRSHIQKLTIGYILSFACNINLKDCEKSLVSEFNNWNLKLSSEDLYPETKEAVLCTGIKFGTEQSWNDVWYYFKNSNVSSEKNSVLRSLGCSTKPNVLKKYLSTLMVSKDPPLDIRKQDYKFVFYSVASRPANTRTAVKFLIQNCELLKNMTNIHMVNSMFGYLGAVISNERDYIQLKKFYDKNKDNLGDFNNTVNNTLSEVRKRIDWINKYENAIEQCLHGSEHLRL